MQVLAAMVPTDCIQVVTPSQSPPSHLFPSHHNSLSSASDQGNRNMSHLKYINLDTISWNVRPIPGQSIYSKLLTLPYHTNPHHPEYQHQKLSASRQKLQRIQQRDHPKHQLHKVWHQTRQSGLALAWPPPSMRGGQVHGPPTPTTQQKPCKIVKTLQSSYNENRLVHDLTFWKLDDDGKPR